MEEKSFKIEELYDFFDKEYLKVLEVLLDSLKKGYKVDENKIAEILKKDVHDVRKILYSLQNQNLVFSKFWKKNKNGWIINSWHLNINELKRYIEEKKKEYMEKCENKIEEENLFFCPICGSSYDYLKAFDFSFMCENCGNPLSSKESYEIEMEFEKEKEKVFVK